MRRKFLLLAFMGALTLVMTSGVRDINSNGAPLGSTGAPGEASCARSTCHTGTAVNSGEAFLDINYGNYCDSYEPGKTYDVIVRLQQSEIRRFGFQLLALNANNECAGTLMVTDNDRTQILTGVGPYDGRRYMTYKYAGTEPWAAGEGQWSFQWKAPDVYVGPVTLYVGAVAANNDGTDDGDTVYTKQLIVGQSATGIKETDNNVFSVYPNPTHGNVQVNFNLPIEEHGVLTLLDLESRICFYSKSVVNGDQMASLDLSGVPPGIYILSMNTGKKVCAQKIMIE
jgi:hypothetical protein